MSRRSRAGSKPVKTRQRKAAAQMRRNAPQVRRHASGAPDRETAFARLTRERDEALEQLSEALEEQTATSEVLRVISASPNELDQVLDSLVKSAVRFCGADDAAIHRLNRQDLRVAAHYGPVPYHSIGHEIELRGTVNGRAVLERTPVHVADLQVETEEFPEGSKGAQKMGFRTTLSVHSCAKASRSAQLTSVGSKRSLLRTSRLRCFRPSPLRPSSPSRTRGCSMNCATR